MNKTIFLFTLIFVSQFELSAQDPEYLDTIANDSCECIADKKATNAQLSTTELGLCLLVSAKEYKSQIMEDYGVDINKMDGKNGENFGELIGLQMAFVCPELLMSLVEEDEELESFSVSGRVSNITKNSIVIFELKTESGKIEKFYWLTFVEADFNLQNSFEDIINKTVNLDYVQQELFDPRIKEYRMVNIITYLGMK